MRYPLKAVADQVIVITGASSGIGLATALSAAGMGARVVLAARNEEALRQAVWQIEQQGGKASFVVADVSRREDVEKLSQIAIERHGGFDTWVNNAGVGIFGRLDEVSEADNRRLFDVNFWGLVHGTQIAAAHLRSKGGAIVNLGSVVSDVAFPLQGMYCASKHAIKGFTDTFRMELEEAGAPVSVTLIKPSAIDTPFAIHARNYMEREPKLPPPLYAPQDVADAILHAAAQGGRDYYIGGGGKVLSLVNQHLPAVIDWFAARAVSPLSSFPYPPNRNRDGNLSDVVQDGAVRGNSPHHVMRSAYTKATLHPVASLALLALGGLAAMALAARNRA